jgi:hypothetical protein
MASIQKRTGGCQVRYRDSRGQQRARQFKRKVDAERFAGEVEVDTRRSAGMPHSHNPGACRSCQ